MKDVICLQLPDGSKTCFVVPILVNNALFPSQVEGPSPDPWIIAQGIQPELAHDMRAIVTMRTIVASMSPEVGHPIQAALEESIKTVAGRLPDGVSLTTQGSG